LINSIIKKPAKQHWLLSGAYIRCSWPDGQSLILNELFSFDAKIWSITDFRSANDRDELPFMLTSLINNVEVLTTSKYHALHLLQLYIKFKLSLKQAYFHEIRISELIWLFIIPDKNVSFVSKLALSTNEGSESVTYGIVMDADVTDLKGSDISQENKSILTYVNIFVNIDMTSISTSHRCWRFVISFKNLLFYVDWLFSLVINLLYLLRIFFIINANIFETMRLCKSDIYIRIKHVMLLTNGKDVCEYSEVFFWRKKWY